MRWNYKNIGKSALALVVLILVFLWGRSLGTKTETLEWSQINTIVELVTPLSEVVDEIEAIYTDNVEFDYDNPTFMDSYIVCDDLFDLKAAIVNDINLFVEELDEHSTFLEVVLEMKRLEKLCSKFKVELNRNKNHPGYAHSLSERNELQYQLDQIEMNKTYKKIKRRAE